MTHDTKIAQERKFNDTVYTNRFARQLNEGLNVHMAEALNN